PQAPKPCPPTLARSTPMLAISSLTIKKSILRLSNWDCLNGSNIRPSTWSMMPSP
ncbi:hypothetical protein EC991_010476, partial [Linnemannia zychae]